MEEEEDNEELPLLVGDLREKRSPGRRSRSSKFGNRKEEEKEEEEGRFAEQEEEEEDEEDDDDDLDARSLLSLSSSGRGPSHAKVRFTEEMPVAAARYGDVMKVSHLLRMAGMDLDDRRSGKSSLRSRGGVVVVHVHYTNRDHWMLWPNADVPPRYTIEVSSRPSYNFRRRELEDHDQIHGQTKRAYLDYYGIRVIVEQTGDLAVFDPLTLLLVLAASLSLLAVATSLTDFLALSVLPQKAKYAEVKYDVSEDLGDHVDA